MMNSVDKNPSVYTGIDMSAAGFKYTGDGDTACCEYCELKVSNWTLDMDPLTIHSQRKPDCPFVRSQKVSSSLTTASEHQNPSGYVKIASSGVEFPLNTLLETNVIQQVRRRAISHWPHRTPSFSALVIEVGFFNCNVGSRVYKTRPPNCPYVKGKLIRFPISSLLIVNGNLARTTSTHLELLQSNKMVFTVAYDPTYAELPKRTWPQENLPSADDLVQVEFFYTGTRIIVTSFYCNGSSHTNNLQLLIPDESTLSTLVDARLHLPICQCLLDENFILSIIKRCWEDQVRLTEHDFYLACLIHQKQIEHIGGKRENIVIPRFRMEYIRECEDKEKNRTNFKEERSITIEREQSFKNWPHSSPSRISMLIAGWLLDTTKGKDYTTCPHCGVECDNWEPNDNPLRIHREWSPCCPFLLSEHPIDLSSVPIQTLKEIFMKEKINNAVAQPTSHLISTSTSPYRLPPKREESFRRFPGGSPRNIEILVRSGFYYTGFSTTLKCYDCGGTVNDLHRYSSNEIDIQHRNQFPYCRFAQLLPRPDELRSTNNADLCKWCLLNPKELAAYPCMHLAVCGPCTQLINSCPICSVEAKAFIKLYM